MDVFDMRLWRRARDLAARHPPDPEDPVRCANPRCPAASPYPCHARRLADHAAAASYGAWPAVWTAIVDLNTAAVSH